MSNVTQQADITKSDNFAGPSHCPVYAEWSYTGRTDMNEGASSSWQQGSYQDFQPPIRDFISGHSGASTSDILHDAANTMYDLDACKIPHVT